MITILVVLLHSTITSSQVAVIAHKTVPINEIKQSKLLDMFTGDIRIWNDGKSVTIFDLKPKSDTKKLFYKYLGKTTSRMKSIWLKNMLSGEADPPEALTTEDDMLQKVATTPGAIGFISASKVTDKVKILKLIATNQSKTQDK